VGRKVIQSIFNQHSSRNTANPPPKLGQCCLNMFIKSELFSFLTHPKLQMFTVLEFV